MKPSTLLIVMLPAILAAAVTPALAAEPVSADWRRARLPPGVIAPEQLEYKGAFTLPIEGAGRRSWGYSPGSLTYCPGGDPAGPEDGHPGSLFGAGHASGRCVAELSIPAPVITQDPAALPVARMLQPFTCVTIGTKNLKGAEFSNPLYALGLVAGKGGPKTDMLYFCGWRAYTPVREHSRGRCSADLTNAKPEGMWTLAGHSAFTGASAIIEIPKAWADKHCPGMTVGWAGGVNGTHGYGAGKGPALVATAPLPAKAAPPGTAIRNVTLLKYGNKSETAIRDCQLADGWHGAAWVTAGKASALLFFGVKDMGQSWYGYAKGPDGRKIFDRKGRPEGQSRFVNDRGELVHKVVGFRGYKRDIPRACITFYDPAELAAVAAGRMKPHEPQPYARLDVSSRMFVKTGGLRGCGYDRRNGLLYVIEPVAGPKTRGHNTRVPVVHVWRIRAAGRTEGETDGRVKDQK